MAEPGIPYGIPGLYTAVQRFVFGAIALTVLTIGAIGAGLYAILS